MSNCPQLKSLKTQEFCGSFAHDFSKM
ncbi:hypothetical protein RDI58_003950 [Solanum bulbocastanum]|uniref:Uncharacterized protein n=1 Tax=Solanum bulbocastanum TaxID=147425 RepID=A0AAN8U0L6_SOLBU